MIVQPLVLPDALEDFPGAPFPRAVVDAAAGAVRDDAGWHIAPQATEVVEVETGRSRVALLPSLYVVAVHEVRDADTGDVLDDWRLSKSKGVLIRRCGQWPEVIEVDFTHGHDMCPPALLPVIAERAQWDRAGIVGQENIGARSVSYRSAYDATNRSTLARYTLPPRP